jgi:hypothetical protein
MKNFTLPSIERHWTVISSEFHAEYKPWISVYSDLLKTVGGILSTFEGRRKLEENCSYPLLSKAINHSLSMYSLTNHGLCVDAALCARNALETLLLLQLCAMDVSGNLFKRWSDGESFRPSWVRRELDKISEVKIRDVVIRLDRGDDTYALSYKWLSEITHANLQSLEYSTRRKHQGSEVIVGGDIRDSGAILNAIFSVVCDTLLWTAIMCASVFSLKYVEDKGTEFSELRQKIDRTAKLLISKTN